MMSTYTQIIYQIVFATKRRIPALTKPNRAELLMYIAGVLQKKKCHVYAVNGVEDHVHIVCSLHPTVALSDLVKDIKLSTTVLIKEKLLFQNFPGWQDGFGAFTYAREQKERVINYVLNQEEHHRKKTFIEEYKEALTEAGVEFDEKYLP